MQPSGRGWTLSRWPTDGRPLKGVVHWKELWGVAAHADGTIVVWTKPWSTLPGVERMAGVRMTRPPTSSGVFQKSSRPWTSAGTPT